MVGQITKLLDAPLADPEETRRRKLLNVLLAIFGVISLLALIIVLVTPRELMGSSEAAIRGIYLALGIGAIIIPGLYALNRYVSGWLAGALFILLLTLIAAASDEPEQVIHGRGLIMFALPIFLSSLLLRLWASFPAAALSGLALAGLSFQAGRLLPNLFSILEFFFLAAIAWLSAQGVERATRQLSINEGQLHLMIDNLPALVAYIGPDQHYRLANSRYADYFGLSPETMIGKSIRQVLGQDSYNVVQGQVQAALAGDQINYQAQLSFPKAGKRWIEASYVPDIDERGQVRGVIVMANDITERKQAEDASTRAAREWQTTFDATNDAVWILDQDQRVLRSNRAAERIFRRASEELIGKHCWEIVHGTAQPIPECPIPRAKNSLYREAMEIQIGEGWFQVTVDPLLDAAGQYAGAVHIVSDVTARKQAEIQLNKQLDELRRGYKAMLGRETRILELKHEVNELLAQAGHPPRYPGAETESQ